MYDAFIGEIMLFPINYNLKNWAPCNGQLMLINQNQALFAQLGTSYGGNGVTTFGLPDLRGRVITGAGPHTQRGQMDGTESVTLLSTNLPSHNHALPQLPTAGPPCSSGDDEESKSPVGAYPKKMASGTYATEPSEGQFMGAIMGNTQIGAAGGNQPLPVMQPTLTMGYYICLNGLWPSRN